MHPTLAMCRAQEARQLALAADAALSNVKGVALLAAAAWAKEAIIAERREQRRAHRDQETLYAPSLLEDRMFSENPDRDLADPGV
jgi:hypothetical protein